MKYTQKTKKTFIRKLNEVNPTLSQPEDSMAGDSSKADQSCAIGYSFRDLINIEELQKMMDLLYDLTDFPIRIIDADNNILVATGWQDICTKFHRIHPETRKKGFECDHYIAEHLTEGRFIEYKCKNGLWDIAQPVILEGKHVATVFLGQFLYEDEKPDIAFFEEQAEKYGFDKDEYIAALCRLPAFSRETIKKVISFYVLLTNTLSKQGLASLKQLRELKNRKKAEQKLREKERRLSTLMANLPGMAYRCRNDKNWTMEFVSNGCQDLTGYPPGDLLLNSRVSYADLIHPEDRQNVWQTVQTAVSQKKHFLLEYRIISKNKDKKWVWEKGCGVYSTDGECLAVEGFIIDNTIRKKAEDTLRESEQKYRYLIEHSDDGIYLFHKGRFEIFNHRFREILGLTSDELKRPEFNIMDVIAPKSKALVKERLTLLAEGKEPAHRFEFTAISKQGKEIELEASVSYFKYKDGMAAQGILRDVTQRKHLERQLAQSQKMESIGTLAGGIAHDFNNLLTVINGHAEISLMKLEKEHPAYKDGVSILHAGEKAADLTRQLLAFSRKQIYQPQIIKINEIISNMDKLLRRLIDEDINIETILSPKTPLIKADSGQLEQILMNLIINARDAVNEKTEFAFEKKITIETGPAFLDEAYVADHVGTKPGFYAVIAISDNGVGMSEEIKNKILEPFFTTKETGKGTGLGLSTVYGIVKQNDGSIYVYSEPDRGTTFKIYWPATGEGATPDLRIVPENLPLSRGEVILFVEDDDGVRNFACSALKQLGYQVYEASNGRKALDLVKEKIHRIDLLISDLIMPEMNGKELASEISARFPEALVLYTSGYTDNHIVHDGLLDQGVHFLHKPYSIHSLAQKIRNVINSGPVKNTKTDPGHYWCSNL